MSNRLIYHMCSRQLWQQACESGSYRGSGDDLRDGFLHFSTADQLAESAARHRAGVSGLVLIAVGPDTLGDALKWEPARGGQSFPHLYAALDTAAVVSVEDLPLDNDGFHIFPEHIPANPDRTQQP